VFIYTAFNYTGSISTLNMSRLSSWLTLVSRSVSPSKATNILRLIAPTEPILQEQSEESQVAQTDIIPQTFTLTPANVEALGLTAGVEYTFQVIATNAAGTAVIGTAGPLIPFTTPGRPTLGTVTAGNKTASVALTSPASSNGTAITNYQYAIGTTASAPVETSFTPFAPSKTTGPFTIPLENNGILYYIWFRAVNAAGAGLTSLSKTVTGVGAPPILDVLSHSGAGTTSQTFTFTLKNNDGTQYSLSSSVELYYSIPGLSPAFAGGWLDSKTGIRTAFFDTSSGVTSFAIRKTGCYVYVRLNINFVITDIRDGSTTFTS